MQSEYEWEHELISKYLIPSRCHFPIQKIFLFLHNNILRDAEIIFLVNFIEKLG